MKDLTQMGADATGTPTILDWKSFYMQKIIPTYHHQPVISTKLIKPTRIYFDGKTIAEIPTFNDIEDPAIGMSPKHKDTEVEGQVVTVPLPQISLTTLLSDDELALPFAQRTRLNRWTVQAVKKFAEFEDKLAFQGHAATGLVGLIGADSHDLGAPTGVWDVDTGSNGILNNAWDDMITAKNYFTHAGLGKRSLHFVMTSYMYTLLASTIVLYTNQTNLELWYRALPDGSTIDYTNNICTAPSGTGATNKMCVLVKLIDQDEGGYQLFTSGIDQKIHKTDVWEQRYGLREKFAIKVVDDAFVAWMDEIDVAT